MYLLVISSDGHVATCDWIGQVFLSGRSSSSLLFQELTLISIYLAATINESKGQWVVYIARARKRGPGSYLVMCIFFGPEHQSQVDWKMDWSIKAVNLVIFVFTALIIPFSVRGIDSQNTHCFSKPQNWWGLKFLMSDTTFMNTCSFTIPFK